MAQLDTIDDAITHAWRDLTAARNASRHSPSADNLQYERDCEHVLNEHLDNWRAYQR